MIIIDIVWTKLPTSIGIKIGIIIVFTSQSPAVSAIKLNMLGIFQMEFPKVFADHHHFDRVLNFQL